jgi:hypothetical protein
VYIYGAFGPVESSWGNNGDGIDALLYVLRALIPTVTSIGSIVIVCMISGNGDGLD